MTYLSLAMPATGKCSFDFDRDLRVIYATFGYQIVFANLQLSYTLLASIIFLHQLSFSK